MKQAAPTAVTGNKATLSPPQLKAQRRCVWVIIRLPKPHIKPHIVSHLAEDKIVQALSPFL